MKKLFTIALFVLVASPIFAQFKIGYCNIEFVLAKYPKMKQVESELKTVQAQYQKQIETLYMQYQQMVQAYQQGGAMMSDLVKADKEKEIQALQNRIQLMENNAQMQIMEKQQELLEPILKDVEAKIQIVANEKGYIYILNQQTPDGSSIILFAKNEEDNITLDVLTKLGVTLTPEEIAAAKAK